MEQWAAECSVQRFLNESGSLQRVNLPLRGGRVQTRPTWACVREEHLSCHDYRVLFMRFGNNILKFVLNFLDKWFTMCLSFNFASLLEVS